MVDQKELWQKALGILKDSASQQTYQTWFAPIGIVEANERAVVLSAPNKFFKSWIKERYAGAIGEAIQKAGGKQYAVEFVISAEGAVLPEAPATDESGEKTDEAADGEGKKHIFPFFFKKHAQPLPSDESRLNPKYTFESFVVGSSNRFAHAAALAISESPAKTYNPLFVYGKVGMGKTHLMQAIGHSILSSKPNMKFIYISSEKFTNQLINAIQTRTTLKFRQMYRNVDLLLIDDIHFIAGKESTQEEFFHTFNALYDAHKQIVVSSDRPPKEISSLEERLVSRFEWGLVTDIQPPDIETRIAILRNKAQREGVIIANEVTDFIAEKIRSNIRELEGALIRVAAYAKLVGQEITLALVKEVLRDVIEERRKKVTVEIIQEKVARCFDIRVADMRNKKRTRAIAYPRQVAMYLTRRLTDYSLPQIGECFGGRDHSTVIHAYEKIERSIGSDEKTRRVVDRLIENITG